MFRIPFSIDNAGDMSQIMQVMWLHKMLCRIPFSTDPTHETCPRSCKLYGSTRCCAGPRSVLIQRTRHGLDDASDVAPHPGNMS